MRGSNEAALASRLLLLHPLAGKATLFPHRLVAEILVHDVSCAPGCVLLCQVLGKAGALGKTGRRALEGYHSFATSTA